MMKPTLLTSKNHTALAALFLSLSLGGCKSDDGGSDEGMGGARGGDGDGAIACESDAQCDDGLFCNGEESCVDGFCQAGERVGCDDGVECTVDRCDERTQECANEAPDSDGDGFASADCEDAEGAPLGTDCDDDDALRFPGNVEICDPDNRDEDCDPSTIGTNDSDNDGFVSDTCCNEQADGELLCGEDCDDFKANVNPLGTEACDFLDNNCDGETDEGVSVLRYPDLDHDGHGDDTADAVETCPSAVGVADDQLDCDDTDPEVFQGQFEICDGKDNNCDPGRLVDEIEQVAPWYRDSDGDTYGDANSTPVFSCYRVPGRVLSRNDCNDSLNTVNPNATEICDGLDNDCNGLADFKLPGVNNFEDDDGDGIADAECGGDDCNDRDARTGLGKEEVCDRIDNDCDGLVDEQTTQNIWYIDEDGDGWGVVLGSALASCDPLENRASNYGDCDDSRNDVRPGVTDTCDGIDNDCDGLIDEGASAYCSIPNANPTCRAGQCRIFSCQAGFADLDNDANNGCEAPVVPVDSEVGCTTSDDCDDGNLCNGFEYCAPGLVGGTTPGTTCYAGTPVNCQALEGVYEGDVTITASSDLQALQGVDWITGDLVIDPTAPTTLLIGLENLRIVGGSVFVQDTNLIALSGSALSGLESVGGDIIIEDNANLVDVDLPSLLSARSLQIRNNPKLAVVGEYGNLTVLDDALVIESNSALERIIGFNALTSVGDPSGEFFEGFYSEACDEDGVIIRNNFGVTEVPTFDALTTVAGDLCIRDVEGGSVNLPELETVFANVSLEDSSLTEIVFPKLESALDIIHVDYSEGSTLQNVQFPELVDSTYVQVGDDYGSMSAPVLQSLEFPKLSSLLGLNIGLNFIEDLQSFDFSSLVEVENNFRVELAGATSQETIAFPALVYGAWYFSASFDLEGMTSLEFPVMTGNSSLEDSTQDLFLSSESTTLETLSLAALSDVAYGLDIDVYATSLEMPQLSSFPFDVYICTGFTDTQQGATFGAPLLLCDETGIELENILPVGFEGSASTCNECSVQQQVDPQL